MTDAELRAAFRAARPTVRSDEPLDIEELWAAAGGVLSPEATGRVVDRVAADPIAALAWRLAVELGQAPLTESTLVTPTRPANDVRGFKAAIGALVIAASLTVAAGPLLREPPPAASTAWRGEVQEEPLPDARVRAGEAAVLAWPGTAGAVWEVVVADADGIEVLRVRDLTTPTVTVPAEVVARLGGDGTWRVTTSTAHGQERRRGSLFVDP